VYVSVIPFHLVQLIIVCMYDFQAYMNALQGQWAWLLQLTMCLQSHLEQASQYYKVNSDAYDLYTVLNSKNKVVAGPL